MNSDVPRMGLSLEGIQRRLPMLRQVSKEELKPGDILFAKTRNSLYQIHDAGRGEVLVSGGWFERKSTAPSRTKVCGCTWGGSVIKVDILAACGMCIEFGNRVTTSEVQTIIVLRGESRN